jgi:hypothetical protein
MHWLQNTFFRLISTIYVILKEEKTKENRLNRLKIDKQDSNKKQTRPKDVKDSFILQSVNLLTIYR